MVNVVEHFLFGSHTRKKKETDTVQPDYQLAY